MLHCTNAKGDNFDKVNANDYHLRLYESRTYRGRVPLVTLVTLYFIYFFNLKNKKRKGRVKLELSVTSVTSVTIYYF